MVAEHFGISIMESDARVLHVRIQQLITTAFTKGAAQEREAIKAIAEAELSNTAALMSMPPQSSAAWNVLQSIKSRSKS
jgi:hypothetical protein